MWLSIGSESDFYLCLIQVVIASAVRYALACRLGYHSKSLFTKAQLFEYKTQHERVSMVAKDKLPPKWISAHSTLT
jgi:hypothetical protein